MRFGARAARLPIKLLLRKPQIEAEEVANAVVRLVFEIAQPMHNLLQR